MSPAISGRMTSLPIIFSMLLSTASFMNVPPCTTTFSPVSSGLRSLMTLYKAFLMTEYDSPADISPIVAPSFCACLTLEFMKTVHLVPRSTGFFENKASCANAFVSRFTDFAYVSRKEPHPAEHASFSIMLYMAPSLIFMHFMSWPPMSSMKSTPGRNSDAAL